MKKIWGRMNKCKNESEQEVTDNKQNGRENQNTHKSKQL